MATMDDSALFVDTNILIYATDPASPWHQAATDAINAARQANVTITISTQVLREYLAVATRLNLASRTPDLAGILHNVQAFRSAFRVLDDTGHVLDRLIQLTQTTTVAGKQVHDANIVATMLVHSINRLLTHNTADFARFAAHITVLPLTNNARP